VLAEWVYNGFYRWNHRRNVFIGIPVGNSADESATSLYKYPGLNPSVILSVKSSEKNPCHHTVATFQTNCIDRQRYGQYILTDVFRRYIPTVLPTDVLCRYILTNFETELFSSVKITNKKILSVSPLVFADFLVMMQFAAGIGSSCLVMALECCVLLKVLKLVGVAMCCT